MAGNSCNGTYGPTFPEDDTSQGCTTSPDGNVCPDNDADKTCNPFQLNQFDEDNCIIDDYVNESLNIAGAPLNVYKLLGVHEQCLLNDATGRGEAISNGDGVGFPASNAFTSLLAEWHSQQTGSAVTASAFLGYDFGEIKLADDSRRKYGIETSVRKHITALLIKQGANSNNRVTRLRVERSSDGVKWYGVQIVDLPDDDCLNTILLRNSVLMRYWRLRPIVFNGGNTDYWTVQALQLVHNYQATNVDNIQDKILLENRDRDYAEDPLQIKGSYDLLDIATELTKYGIELPAQSIYMQVNFSACVAILGRPLIIGDIVEMPSELQFSAELRPILKWMEVTDVAWSTDGYTPGWKPTMQRVILQPAYASQETQDIFGDLAEQELPDELGLVDKGTGRDQPYQDYSDVSQEIQEEAKEMTPESGREFSSTVRTWETGELEAAAEQGVPEEQMQRIGFNRPNALYAEDAMPPNNAPFTEGPDYPVSPSHGDYHRLTYEGLSKDVPARLYRYSSAKGRWVYLETDRRAEYDPNKPRIQEFLTSETRKRHQYIVRDDPGVCDTREE